MKKYVTEQVIPCLLLNNGSLVKTVQFGKYSYIGDPLNTCRIFNELEVDEMSIIDISAAKNRGSQIITYCKGWLMNVSCHYLMVVEYLMWSRQKKFFYGI